MQITTENQLATADGRLYSHDDCGLCCALSMALDAGCPADETVSSMETWYTAHGDSPADGTGLAVNVAWLLGEGLTASTYTGGMDIVDSLLAKGYRVTMAIYSNSFGTPYSGPGNVGHFVEVCATDGTTYTVMQPVGGQIVRYTRAQLSDNSQQCGFYVEHDYRTPVTTVIGTSSGGKPMDSTLIFRGLVQIIMRLTFGRAATAAEMDWWVSHATALGAGGAEWEIEEALGGDNVIGTAYAAAFARLHKLATS